MQVVTFWKRHIGPMAEDFDEEFGFGRSADRINTVDADGVALAAIQGLSQKLDDARDERDETDERIADLANDTDDLRAENDRLCERVAELEALPDTEAHPNADSARGATGD